MQPFKEVLREQTVNGCGGVGNWRSSIEAAGEVISLIPFTNR